MVTKDVQIQGSDYIESYIKTNYDDFYWEYQFLDKITTYVSDLFNGPNWNIEYTTDARNIPTDTQDPYSWMDNNDNYSGFEFMAIHNSETTDDVTGRGDEGGYSWVKFSDEDIDEMVGLGTSNGPGKPIGNTSDSQPSDGQLFGIFHEICHMYGGEHETGLTNRNYYDQVNYRTPHGPSGDKYDSYSNCNGTHYLDSSLPDHPVVGVSDCWNPPSGVKIVTESDLAQMDFF